MFAGWRSLTCTFGQPVTRYEGPAQGLKTPQLLAQRYDVLKNIEHTLLGDAYWFIDNKTALDQNWEKIKAQKPAAITIYLLDADKNGGKEGYGLSAEMAKAVIKKAHRSDLRVYAYVLNAADVRLGIKAGRRRIRQPARRRAGWLRRSQTLFETDRQYKALVKKKTVVIPFFSCTGRSQPPPCSISRANPSNRCSTQVST